MKAIIYTSNAGSAAAYARMLGNRIGLPVYSLDEAKGKVAKGSDIIYIGWIMASGIKGYKAAAKRYKIAAVCATCMGSTGSQISEVRNKNNISEELPVFTLQGGFDITKLHGVYKMMMSVMVRTAGKALAKKTDRTPEDDDMLEMMVHGKSHVCEENLKAVLDWYMKKGEN